MSTFTEELNRELAEEALADFEDVGILFFETITNLIEAVAVHAEQKGYEDGYRDAVSTLSVGDPAEAEAEYDPDVCYDPDCPVCYPDEAEDDGCSCPECQIARLEDNQIADAVVIEALLYRVAALEALAEDGLF